MKSCSHLDTPLVDDGAPIVETVIVNPKDPSAFALRVRSPRYGIASVNALHVDDCLEVSIVVTIAFAILPLFQSLPTQLYTAGDSIDSNGCVLLSERALSSVVPASMRALSCSPLLVRHMNEAGQATALTELEVGHHLVGVITRYVLDFSQ